jgi:hypothetical protein
MAQVQGTRVYWRPSTSTPGTEPVQILKNSGYISVTLQAVQYKAGGDWWQRTFGGSDKITVSTQVTWQNGANHVTAAAIQDFRKVSVPSVNALAMGRNIVLKVPASADGIELQLDIHAVHADNLAKTLQLLNSDEFKQPLQLAPVAVGEVLSISNLVKKTFTDAEGDALTATYPGIVSLEQMTDPVGASRIVQGYIVVIVKQDDSDQLDFEPSTLTIAGNRVLSNGQPIDNTYMVYNVTFDKWRGADPTSPAAKKFAGASSKADELIFATPDQRQGIIAAARDLLMQGKGLLDADDTFLDTEKAVLANAAFQAVADKIKANAGGGQAARVAGVGERFADVPAIVATIERNAEDRAAVNEYAAELAEAGLHLGFNLDARPSTLPVTVSPATTRAASARPGTWASAAPACASQTFSEITPEKWQRLVTKAAESGIPINGNEGRGSYDGVTVSWKYDATTDRLTLTCVSKPFLVACSLVNAKLHDLVDACSGS